MHHCCYVLYEVNRNSKRHYSRSSFRIECASPFEIGFEFECKLNYDASLQLFAR